VQVTAQLLVMCVVAKMSLGLRMALVLNRQISSSGLLPAPLHHSPDDTNVVSAMMWRMMMDPGRRVPTTFLSATGFYEQQIAWFASPIWCFGPS